MSFYYNSGNCNNFAPESLQREIKMRLITVIASLLLSVASYAQSYKELVSDGTRHLEKGETEAAIKSYNEAVEKEPENKYNEFVYANMAAAYQKNGKKAKAEEMYTKALSLNPSSIKLLQQRGNLYLDSDNSKKALADYNKILEQEPFNEEALYYRAYIFANDKEHEKAYSDYYKILTANPDNDKARFALALLYGKENRNEEAMLLIDNLIDKNPHEAEYYLAGSEIEKAEKKYELAIVFLDEGIKKCKNANRLYLSKAELLIKMKRRDEAKNTLDKLARTGYYSAQMNTLYKKCR